VLIELAGTLLQGATAVREHIVRPSMTGFPGNRHVLKKLSSEKTSSSWNGVLKPNTRARLVDGQRPPLTIQGKEKQQFKAKRNSNNAL
jgi:hypothetical protein